MLKRVISEAPKAAVLKQARGLAAPAVESSVGSASEPIASGGGAPVAEAEKAAGVTGTTVRGGNCSQGQQANVSRAAKKDKEPVRKGVMQNLFF